MIFNYPTGYLLQNIERETKIVNKDAKVLFQVLLEQYFSKILKWKRGKKEKKRGDQLLIYYIPHLFMLLGLSLKKRFNTYIPYLSQADMEKQTEIRWIKKCLIFKLTGL